MDYNITDIIDQLSGFINSDAWRILQYKILLYKQSQQNKMNANIRASNTDKSKYFLGTMDGTDTVIEITERLIDDVKKGNVRVDVALSVIENKQREGR